MFRNCVKRHSTGPMRSRSPRSKTWFILHEHDGTRMLQRVLTICDLIHTARVETCSCQILNIFDLNSTNCDTIPKCFWRRWGCIFTKRINHNLLCFPCTRKVQFGTCTQSILRAIWPPLIWGSTHFALVWQNLAGLQVSLCGRESCTP